MHKERLVGSQLLVEEIHLIHFQQLVWGGNIVLDFSYPNGNGTGVQFGGVIQTDGVETDVDITYDYSWVRNGYSGSESIYLRVYAWMYLLRVDDANFWSTGYPTPSPSTNELNWVID